MSEKRLQRPRTAKKVKEICTLPNSFESFFNSYFDAFFEQIRAQDEAKARALAAQPKAEIIPFPKARR